MEINELKKYITIINNRNNYHLWYSIFFVMPYFDESYAIKKDSKNNNDPGYDYEFNIELF